MSSNNRKKGGHKTMSKKAINANHSSLRNIIKSKKSKKRKSAATAALSVLMKNKFTGKSKGAIRRKQVIFEKKLPPETPQEHPQKHPKKKGWAPGSMKHKELACKKRSIR